MKLFQRRGEEGLTLNELLIAMLITTIIMVPLVGAMFTTMHVLVGTESRIDESNSATLLGSYFGPDVQNAVTVTNSGAVESTAVCGSSAMAVDLLMTTSQPGDTPQASVSYYHAGAFLFRRTCSGGTAGPVERLVHNLSGAPAFSCGDSAGAPIACSAAWQMVKGSVTQLDPQKTNAPYTTNVQASKRLS
jgi:hypothetical protein